MYNIIYNIVIRKLYLFRKSSPFLIHFLAFFFVLFLDAQLAALLDWIHHGIFAYKEKSGRTWLVNKHKPDIFNLPEWALGAVDEAKGVKIHHVSHYIIYITSSLYCIKIQ